MYKAFVQNILFGEHFSKQKKSFSLLLVEQSLFSYNFLNFVVAISFPSLNERCYTITHDELYVRSRCTAHGTSNVQRVPNVHFEASRAVFAYICSKLFIFFAVYYRTF